MTGLWPGERFASALLQYFFSGLTLGSIYAIVGLSFNIIYKDGAALILVMMFMPRGLAHGLASSFRYFSWRLKQL